MVASVPGQAYNSNMGGTIAPGSVAVTEDKTTTGGSVGGCGEASLLAVVAPQIPGTSTNPSALGALIQWADNHGLTLAANGDSSPSNLIGIAKQYFSVTVNSFSSLPTQYIGNRQIEVGISRAYNLGGWNSNVNGHYITIVGKTGDGNYIVSDPNQPESEQGQFIVYTPQQIQNAAPFWYGVANNPPQGTGPGSTTTLSSTTGFDWGSFLSGVGGFITNPGAAIAGIANTNASPLVAIEAALGTAAAWVGNPIRIIKLVVGVLMLGAVILVVILPEAAPTAVAVGAVATGNPELAAPLAGATSSIFRKPGTPSAPPPPASTAVPGAIGAVGKAYQTNSPKPQPVPPQRQYGTPLPPTPAPPAPAGHPAQRLGAMPTIPITPVPTAVGGRTAPTTKPLPVAPAAPRNVLGPSNPPKPAVTKPIPTQNFPPIQPPKPAVTKPLAPPTGAPRTVPLPPVQRAPATGLSTPRAAPITAPLGGPKTLQTGMPMTPEESAASKASLTQSFAGLQTGQSAVGVWPPPGREFGKAIPVQGKPQTRKDLEERADKLAKILRETNPEGELKKDYEEQLADIMRQLRGG